MKCAIAALAVCAVGVSMAGRAHGLEIQVAPRNLVVSSGGDNLTIHTNFPGDPGEDSDVFVQIAPAGGCASTVAIIDEFWDDCGFYVVRCDRQAAAAAVGEFEGRRTTATVTLCIAGDCGAQEITVQK